MVLASPSHLKGVSAVPLLSDRVLELVPLYSVCYLKPQLFFCALEQTNLLMILQYYSFPLPILPSRALHSIGGGGVPFN